MWWLLLGWCKAVNAALIPTDANFRAAAAEPAEIFPPGPSSGTGQDNMAEDKPQVGSALLFSFQSLGLSKAQALDFSLPPLSSLQTLSVQ